MKQYIRVNPWTVLEVDEPMQRYIEQQEYRLRWRERATVSLTILTALAAGFLTALALFLLTR